MPKCIICGAYTKYANGKCSACYNNKVAHDDNMTKKELRARNKATPQATKIHDALLKNGVSSKVEWWDGYKHIDIAIPHHHLNIEVDGVHHNVEHTQALADLKRTFYSFKKGYFTLRIPNTLIDNHFDDCIQLILEIIKEADKNDIK